MTHICWLLRLKSIPLIVFKLNNDLLDFDYSAPPRIKALKLSLDNGPHKSPLLSGSCSPTNLNICQLNFEWKLCFAVWVIEHWTQSFYFVNPKSSPNPPTGPKGGNPILCSPCILLALAGLMVHQYQYGDHIDGQTQHTLVNLGINLKCYIKPCRDSPSFPPFPPCDYKSLHAVL